MNPEIQSDLVLAVEELIDIQTRAEAESASDGGGTGRSDNNDRSS